MNNPLYPWGHDPADQLRRAAAAREKIMQMVNSERVSALQREVIALRRENSLEDRIVARIDAIMRQQITRIIAAMTTKSIGKAKLTTDKAGKTKLVRVHTYDASKARQVAKSKTKRVVAPARAKAARGR